MNKTLKELNLKSSYETGRDDVVGTFYDPVLKCATSYDRIAGFFSSSSLAIAAKGIAGFIKNKGKMRIIACPRLNEKDVEILKTVEANPEEFLDEKLKNTFDDIEDSFQENHILALGWMIANGYLELRLALVKKNGKFCTTDEINHSGIFHQKIGILRDDQGNKISFSGSINETASGWIENIEEFKVFRSWGDEKKYLLDDEEKFEAYWNNRRDSVKTYTLPESIKRDLIIRSKDYKPEYQAIQFYKQYCKQRKKTDALNLFFYQKDAIKMWKKNGKRLLFQMATGTGKTRTAIGCISELLTIHAKYIVIVATPQGTLSLQWKKEIENSPIDFDEYLVVDGTNRKWKIDLQEIILRVSTGFADNCIIFTTHKTCSNPFFVESIERGSSDIKYLFIGDEAHGLGATKTKKALANRYDYRIGLSATPSRWFDESGTKILEMFFGNNVFEFSIFDALTTVNPVTGKTFLVPYYYNLEFVDLSVQEIEEYEKITNDVKKLSRYSKDSEEYAERIETLIFKRANIIKNAENKYQKLREILTLLGKNVKDLIVFVSPEQLNKTLYILKEYDIVAHSFTQEAGTIMMSKYGDLTERQFLIENFRKGHYQALVAIKCLDEGIDIPSAQNAILMASSTNPREYIQRIGRVIRYAEGKKNANIWDISIRPCVSTLSNPYLREFEKKICEKEKNRIFDISDNAINNVEALQKLYKELGE